MAIYSFNSSIIKRSTIMFAVKLSANISKDKLYDKRLNKRYFVKKGNIICEGSL